MSETPIANERCNRCDQEVPQVWFAENDVWNRVCGGPTGILCPNCFIRLAAEKGYTPCWRLDDADKTDSGRIATLERSHARLVEAARAVVETAVVRRGSGFHYATAKNLESLRSALSAATEGKGAPDAV